jgi:hypothetical protein
MFSWINTAVSVQEACLKHKFPFAFIGGVALQRWGEPRVTIDVDLTLFTGFGNEEKFIQTLLAIFPARSPDAAEFALQRRVLLLQSTEGIGIDISLAGLPFEQCLIDRASYADYLPGIQLNTCSAEDLIITKSFANRPQDWIDVDRILVRQGEKLDWEYICKHLKELLVWKEAPEILDRLKKLRAERDANP